MRHAPTIHARTQSRHVVCMVHLAMVHPDQIKPNTPVIATNDAVFAVVDRVEGSASIRLGKDSQGQHHFIPLGWVKAVTDKVHIDRPAGQALREWSTEPTHPAHCADPHAASIGTLGPTRCARSLRRRSRRPRSRA